MIIILVFLNEHQAFAFMKLMRFCSHQRGKAVEGHGLGHSSSSSLKMDGCVSGTLINSSIRTLAGGSPVWSCSKETPLWPSCAEAGKASADDCSGRKIHLPALSLKCISPLYIHCVIEDLVHVLMNTNTLIIFSFT